MKSDSTQQRDAANRRFKRYPHYRHTNIGWLDSTPKHWDVKRLKFVANLNPAASELNGMPLDSDVSFVPMEAVSETGVLDLSRTRPLASVGSGYTYFRDGDVIVAKITPCFENGKGACVEDLTNGIGFGTTELHVLRPRPSIDQRYLFYLTLTDAFRRLGEADMYGAGGQKRVPGSFIANLKHPIPSISEQRIIVAFLDQEIARIDGLLAKKDRLIKLLEEKREAVIWRAVTKGMHSRVAMRPSDIEWLGDVPSHWKIARLKHVCDRNFVGIAQAATFAYADDGVPMLRSTDVRAHRIRTDNIRKIDRDFADGLSSKQLRANDIVTVRTGNAGVSAVVPAEYDGGQCFTLVVSRLTKQQDSRYFSYWLNSICGQQQFNVEGIGTAQVNISVPIVQNIVVCVPPYHEQQQIVEWIGREVACLDALGAQVREAIEHLKEFRTALISAAVTGKIDVRDAA